VLDAELLDVDVDSVDTEVAGQRYELPIVRSRASEFVKKASFFSAPNDV
jgi:hypothetical protein